MNDFYYVAENSNIFAFVSFFLYPAWLLVFFASCTILNRVVDDDAAK